MQRWSQDSNQHVIYLQVTGNFTNKFWVCSNGYLISEYLRYVQIRFSILRNVWKMKIAVLSNSLAGMGSSRKITY